MKILIQSMPLLLFGLLVMTCGQVYSDPTLIPLVEDAIETALNEPDTPAVLSLSRVIDTPWEQVVIFTPYSDPRAIEKEMDIQLDRAQHTHINSRDDIHVLLFLRQGETLRMLEYPRSKGDFKLDQTTLFEREDAIFRITRQADGPVSLQPIALE